MEDNLVSGANAGRVPVEAGCCRTLGVGCSDAGYVLISNSDKGYDTISLIATVDLFACFDDLVNSLWCQLVCIHG